MSLINCKVELKLRWTKDCVFPVTGNKNNNANVDLNNIVLNMKDGKLYIPVVILSAKDNQKLLKFIGKGFETLVY